MLIPVSIDEPTMGADGGLAGPALGGGEAAATPPVADAPPPVAAAPGATVDPSQVDPQALGQMLGSLQELTSLFNDVRGAYTGGQPAEPQLPPPPGYDYSYDQPPPAVGPAAPAAPAVPAADPVAAALSAYDPFRPESLAGVLEAQQSTLLEGVKGILAEALGGITPVIEEIQQEKGQTIAKEYLTSLHPHLGPFDVDRALDQAALLAANGWEEGQALQHAARETARWEQQIGMRYVQAYRQALQERATAAGGPGEPAVTGAAVPGAPALPTGPGKYAQVVRDGIRRREAARSAATV